MFGNEGVSWGRDSRKENWDQLHHPHHHHTGETRNASIHTFWPVEVLLQDPMIQMHLQVSVSCLVASPTLVDHVNDTTLKMRKKKKVPRTSRGLSSRLRLMERNLGRSMAGSSSTTGAGLASRGGGIFGLKMTFFESAIFSFLSVCLLSFAFCFFDRLGVFLVASLAIFFFFFSLCARGSNRKEAQRAE